MTSLSRPNSSNLNALTSVRWLNAVRLSSPPLFWAGLSLLAISLICAALPLVDDRVFQGVSVWLKPWKFQVSVGFYFLTLALFMVFLPKCALSRLPVRALVWVSVSCGLFEVIYVSLQGVRGLGSHYNTGTPFYALMYALMGLGAVFLTGASLALAVVIGRSDDYAAPSVLKLSIVLGLTLTFFLGTGFGVYLGGNPGGHWVGGVLSDAGGLPVLHWSRTGGDLRVAHFFGIHAMHFLPAFGALLVALRIRVTVARVAVWCFAALLVAVSMWSFVHALNGRPFIA